MAASKPQPYTLDSDDVDCEDDEEDELDDEDDEDDVDWLELDSEVSVLALLDVTLDVLCPCVDDEEVEGLVSDVCVTDDRLLELLDESEREMLLDTSSGRLDDDEVAPACVLDDDFDEDDDDDVSTCVDDDEEVVMASVEDDELLVGISWGSLRAALHAG